MANLHEKIVNDWKVALKNKDERKSGLSLIITEFKNRAIKENTSKDGARVVNDEQATEVLQKMAKQRRESIESYQSSSREDLLNKEKLELLTIESYLPKPLSDGEVHKIVAAAISESGADSMKDIGKVMGLAIKSAEGRADGKRIQKIVQDLLSKS